MISLFLPIKPLATTSQLSVSMDSLILNISYKWIHTVFFCVWLLSLKVLLFSRLIHLVACISSLYLNNTLL